MSAEPAAPSESADDRASHLGACPAPGGGRIATVEWLAEVGSTNDRAREHAASPASLPALVVADRQTAGRGRGDRRWWSGDGALTFSLALPRSSCGDTRLLALAAGAAVAEAVEQVTPLRAGFKWPNDVQLDGKKLAGVLIEATPAAVVVGVGVNVGNSLGAAPDELRRTATAIVDELRRHAAGVACPSRLVVLQAWLEAFARHTDPAVSDPAVSDPAACDPAACDPTDLLAAVNARCVLRGKRVTIRDGNRRLSGRVESIRADGALLLRETDGKSTAVLAGSVESIHRAPSTEDGSQPSSR